MTQFLPPNLLSLFFPREPLPFKVPPKKNKCPKAKNYTGISAYLDYFDEPKDEPPVLYETRFERRERKLRERQEHEEKILEEKKQKWDPKTRENVSTDPYKTLFVGRLSYETQESKLKREFEIYGPIRQIYVAQNKFTGKARGYAFIEFEHTRDMHAAYKHMDGKKIDSRRIIVDAERGRTETDWLPRYLGGGLGGHRRAANTRPDEKLGAIKTNNFVRTEREREHTTEKRDREDRFQSRDKGRDNENSRNNNNFQYRDRRRSRSRHDSQRRYKEDDKRKKERKH